MQRPPKFLKVAYSLCAIVVTGGCLSATFVPTSGAYPARASDCDIEVFSSAVPDREYEEIGIVEGEGSAWKADLEDVLPKLKEGGAGLEATPSSWSRVPRSRRGGMEFGPSASPPP